MDPLIGLVWLDSVDRKDYRLQILTLVLILVDAGVWLQYVYPANLIFDPSFPMFLFSGRGLYLGIAVIGILLAMSFGSRKRDLVLEGNATLIS